MILKCSDRDHIMQVRVCTYQHCAQEADLLVIAKQTMMIVQVSEESSFVNNNNNDRVIEGERQTRVQHNQQSQNGFNSR